MNRISKSKANSLLKNLFSIFIIFFILNIVVFPKNSISYVHDALNICYMIIIPSLLPFMIFSKIFMNTPLFFYLNRALSRPAQILFGIHGMYAGAFLIGLLSGFPAGAKNTVDIYENHPQTKQDAERTLGFCNCASTSFVISAVGLAVFKSVYIGFLLYVIHVICSVATGIIIKFIYQKKNDNDDLHNAEKTNKISQDTLQPQMSISQNITDAITSSITGILQICGIIICFSVMANILVDIVKIIDMHSFIKNKDMKILSFLLNGILELSSGVKSLSAISSEISIFAKFIISALLLSFGGISVHIQIFNVVKETDLSLKPYFTGKIINGIITFIIAFVFYKLNKQSIRTYYVYQSFIPIPNTNYNTYISCLICTMIVSLIVLFSSFFIMILAYLIDRRTQKVNVKK